jgi:hypothetical protein
MSFQKGWKRINWTVLTESGKKSAEGKRSVTMKSNGRKQRAKGKKNMAYDMKGTLKKNT